jgi:hypothetical protein
MPSEPSAEERIARAIALHFTPNKQPDMSGDTFAKLLPHQKRAALEAARTALEITERDTANRIWEAAAKIAEEMAFPWNSTVGKTIADALRKHISGD